MAFWVRWEMAAWLTLWGERFEKVGFNLKRSGSRMSSQVMIDVNKQRHP